MPSDKALRDLHELVVQDLISRIRSGAATAADLGVARQLLKDNGIDCNPRKDAPIMKLYEALPFSPEQDEMTA